MTWSPTRLDSSDELTRGAPLPVRDRQTIGPALAEAEAFALEAMGVGVIACDASLLVVDASRCARRYLARMGPATEVVPGPLGELVRRGPDGRDRPARLVVDDEAYDVWVRPVEHVWVSLVLWLRLDTSRPEIDGMLRRRFRLTPRQLDLIHELRLGHRNREIATNLGLTESTVKSYLSHVFDAIGVTSRGEAIALIERIYRGE